VLLFCGLFILDSEVSSFFLLACITFVDLWFLVLLLSVAFVSYFLYIEAYWLIILLLLTYCFYSYYYHAL
jgi:hypothetical protein